MDQEHDEAKPISAEQEEDLIERLGRWESQSRQHWGNWQKEARESYKFVAGEHWSDNDKAVLLEEGRVPIVFNRVDPMISAVLGAEVLNRQEVTYLPREIGDVRTNEIINEAAQWVRDVSDVADEESDAFLDVIVTGLGWTETRMDYEEDIEGLIRVDRVSPLKMWVDPAARKRGLIDRRYHWHGENLDRHEVKARWPDKYGQILNAMEQDDSVEASVTSAGDDYEEGPDETSGDQNKSTKMWVRHFQWFDLVDAFRVVDPDSGESQLLRPDQWKGVVQEYLAMGERPPSAVKMKTRQYYRAFLAGKVLLSKEPIDGWTFHCMTGKRDEASGTWYGLVRAMRDPQMWANKWFSQIMHILNTSAKGGLMYEEGAVDNERKLKENWARPDGTIKLKSGALARGAIQERTAANYPQGLDRLMQFSFDAMPQVSGINLEMMGLVGKDQPGVLEAHRKQAGYAILAQFFDALKLYRKRQGRTLLDYIQNYISDGRLIRVTGDEGTQEYIPLIRNDETIKYDVIVDDAPMSANQKQNVWQMIVQMMPMLQEAPLPADVWADLLKYSPLPNAVSAKIGQALTEAQEAAQQPDPAEEAAEQREQLKVESQAGRDEAAAVRDEAQAHKTAAETEQIMLETEMAGEFIQ